MSIPGPARVADIASRLRHLRINTRRQSRSCARILCVRPRHPRWAAPRRCPRPVTCPLKPRLRSPPHALRFPRPHGRADRGAFVASWTYAMATRPSFAPPFIRDASITSPVDRRVQPRNGCARPFRGRTCSHPGTWSAARTSRAGRGGSSGGGGSRSRGGEALAGSASRRFTSVFTSRQLFNPVVATLSTKYRCAAKNRTMHGSIVMQLAAISR